MRMIKVLTQLVAILLLTGFPLSVEARDLNVLVNNMTLEEKIGQMLLPAFRMQEGRDITEITQAVSTALQRYRVGGVILFRENLVTPEQTRRLINDLQGAAQPGMPLFIGIDQEGGRVSRLPYGVVMPGNMALGATGSAENAFLAARAVGEELVELGFNLNFAPVLDINSNPDNPVIGVRSFGEDPDAVAVLGKAVVRGLHAAGIAAVVKHFPGHGDTSVDSHLGLPSLPHDLTRLEERELRPFRAALSESPDMVMTAHIALPAIEPELILSAKDGSFVHLPATLSPAVLTGLLRNRLGYEGVIITDALNMKAIVEHFGPAEAAVRAAQAGADILLMPDLEKSHSALLAAVKRGDISEARVDQSVRRILEIKEKHGLFSAKMSNYQPEAKKQRAALEARLAGQAVTLLKNNGRVLPFALEPWRKVLLLAPNAEQLSAMYQETEKLFQAAGLPANIQALEYQREVAESHQVAIETADMIVLATESADAAGRDPTRSPAAAVAAKIVGMATATNKPLVVIATRNPYDIAYVEAAPACIAVYAPVAPNIIAGIRVIFGYLDPQGRLPVTIPGKDGGVLYPRGFGLAY